MMKHIDGWNRCLLDSILEDIQSGSRPKGGASSESGEIPSLGGENIKKNGGLNLTDVKKVTHDYYSKMSKGHLQQGDILINKDGAQTGKVGFYDIPTNFLSCINEHLFLLRGRKDKVVQKYLYYNLISENSQNQIRAQISGSAQPGLKTNFINGVTIELPKLLKEQSQVVEVLETIDEAIDETEALIAKQVRIKTGLMQDLLTKGLDGFGNIRSEETHKFKDSPLGKIPAEWKVEKIGNVLKKINQGWSPDCEARQAGSGEWGVLKTSAVDWQGYFDYENKALPDSLTPKVDLEVKTGDLLMTRAGPNSRVGVVSYVYQTREKLMVSDKIYRLIPVNEVESRFLCYSLSSFESQKYLSNFKTGMAESQTNISQEIVKNLLTVVPDKNEQIVIADLLDLTVKEIENTRSALKKLLSVKSALMQDLLTGKKRVTPILRNMEEVSQ